MSPRRSLQLLLVCTVVVAVHPPSAVAGTFDVVACDPAVAGGANNAFAPYADFGMTAYTDCRQSGEGLVARNIKDPSNVPGGNRAAMIFDTPTGTTIDRVSFDGALERHTCSYSVILAAGGPDFGGRAVWGYGAGQQCGYPQAASPTDFELPNQRVELGGVTRFRLESQCTGSSCSRNGRAAIRLRNVHVTVRDDIAPQITSARGPLWSTDGWIGGTQDIGLTATDNTGIRQLQVITNGQPAALQQPGCDYTLRTPCPSSGDLSRGLPTANLGKDGRHQLRVSAVDAAGNETHLDRSVLIDNTAPDAPQDLSVAGGEGWRASNSFDVRWRDPVQQFAPITTANYELCPPSGTGCVTGSSTSQDIARIGDLKVPGPGEWRLKVWLQDAATNSDRRLTAPPVVLRFDDTSPDASIEHPSADNPTQLIVDTQDTGSGLGSGSIELRQVGSAQWRPQAALVDGTRLIGLIGDEQLPDGQYDVRATAIDQAGNARTTQSWSDGQTAQITMPLRLKTSLQAGVPRRHGRLARAASVSYGPRVRVRGRLLSPEGNPLQDVTVEATGVVAGAASTPTLLASVKTSRTGTFSFLVRKGPSRTVTVRYGGTARIRSATAVVQLAVRSRTTIRPSRRRLVNGQSVRLAGRIVTGRIPRPGKLVEVQVFVRGRWRTFATTRSTRRGSWHYDYRFDGTRGTQSYRFRAQIPRESGYPFAAGHSGATQVHVRGT